MSRGDNGKQTGGAALLLVTYCTVCHEERNAVVCFKVYDFFEYYSLDSTHGQVYKIVEVLEKRLPVIVLSIPVQSRAKKTLQIKFSANDNITSVVDAFINVYGLAVGGVGEAGQTQGQGQGPLAEETDELRATILRRASIGMYPSSFLA